MSRPRTQLLAARAMMNWRPTAASAVAPAVSACCHLRLKGPEEEKPPKAPQAHRGALQLQAQCPLQPERNGLARTAPMRRSVCWAPWVQAGVPEELEFSRRLRPRPPQISRSDGRTSCQALQPGCAHTFVNICPIRRAYDLRAFAFTRQLQLPACPCKTEWMLVLCHSLEWCCFLTLNT